MAPAGRTPTRSALGAESSAPCALVLVQVLFLLYHYFEAKEAYSAIRIFIAAYVWMTGFGNFSYYYKTGDFCIGRCVTSGCESRIGA